MPAAAETDPSDETTGLHLSRPQRTRLSLAAEDLERVRRTDLAALDPASLVLLVERLRGSLDDVVRMVGELTQQ